MGETPTPIPGPVVVIGQIIDGQFFPTLGDDPRYRRLDGRMLARDEFPSLFDLIGYEYGGKGAEFAIPNYLPGRFFIKVRE